MGSAQGLVELVLARHKGIGARIYPTNAKPERD